MTRPGFIALVPYSFVRPTRRDGQKLRAALTGAVTGALLEKGYEKIRDHNKKGSSSKGDDH